MLRRHPLLIALLVAVRTSAQVDEPPPSPPPVGAVLTETRQLVWTPFERKDWSVSGSFPTEAGEPKVWLWHLGATEFLSSKGLRLQTSIEYTTLFEKLRILSLDSLSRFYWTPRFLEQNSILFTKDSVFAGSPSKYLEIKSNLNGVRWRVMMIRPAPKVLIAFMTQGYNEREDEIADAFFASIALNNKISFEKMNPNVLLLDNGQYYVNDTLGYSMYVHRRIISRNTLSEGPVTVYARVTDEYDDLPVVCINTVLREHKEGLPPLTAQAMATSMEQQGFMRRSALLVNDRPAVMLDMLNERGEYWQSYVIEVSGDVIHSVLVAVPAYWGDAFASEVISSMRIQGLKKP